MGALLDKLIDSILETIKDFLKDKKLQYELKKTIEEFTNSKIISDTRELNTYTFNIENMAAFFAGTAKIILDVGEKAEIKNRLDSTILWTNATTSEEKERVQKIYELYCDSIKQFYRTYILNKNERFIDNTIIDSKAEIIDIVTKGFENINDKLQVPATRVTDITNGLPCHMVYYTANIASSHLSVSDVDARNALVISGRYPSDISPINISQQGNLIEDDEDDFYSINAKNLQRAIKSRIIDIVTNGDAIALFAIAPQPLLMLAGRLLNDKYNVTVFQCHRRETDKWKWNENFEKIEFQLSEVTPENVSPDTKIALIFSLSALIIPERIISVLGEDTMIYTVTIDSPKRTFVNNPSISIIITTLAAHAYDGEVGIYDAVCSILKSMANYIKKEDSKYYIQNPSNLQENFADKWNSESNKAKVFYEWLEKAKKDIILQAPNIIDDYQMLEKVFGETIIDRAVSEMDSITHDSNLPDVYATHAIQEVLNAPHRQKPNFNLPKHYLNGKITATVTSNGISRTYENNGKAIPKNCEINFNFGVSSTLLRSNYIVKWQVVNTGYEARMANGLRGGFNARENSTKWHESTLYRGTHFVQAFLLKQGKCVAVSKEFIVNIE